MYCESKKFMLACSTLRKASWFNITMGKLYLTSSEKKIIHFHFAAPFRSSTVKVDNSIMRFLHHITLQ